MFLIELVLLCGFLGAATSHSKDDDDLLPSPGFDQPQTDDAKDNDRRDHQPPGSGFAHRGFGTTVFHNYGGSP